MEVVYREEALGKLPDNGFYTGIDLGLDNLGSVKY